MFNSELAFTERLLSLPLRPHSSFFFSFPALFHRCRTGLIIDVFLLLLTSLTSAAVVRFLSYWIFFFLIFLLLLFVAFLSCKRHTFHKQKNKTRTNIKGVRTSCGPRHLITAVASCACGGGGGEAAAALFWALALAPSPTQPHQ